MQVELVLTAIEQRWSRTADPSQVRYFIFKVRQQQLPCAVLAPIR